jgi:hypothetical protein
MSGFQSRAGEILIKNGNYLRNQSKKYEFNIYFLINLAAETQV